MAKVRDWTFEGTWPFEPRWFDSPDGRMHYLETLWLDTFPDASVTRLEDAGHYLQEDAHERIVPELVSFVNALAA